MSDIVVSFHNATPWPFERKSADASGFDLHAFIPNDKECVLHPLCRARVPTGIYLAMPRGMEAQVRPRSGRALKEGLTVLNSPGTVDADYRDELAVLLINFGKDSIVIRHGDRIAQVVFCPVAIPPEVEFVRVDDPIRLPPSDRGTSGWGSTGR